MAGTENYAFVAIHKLVLNIMQFVVYHIRILLGGRDWPAKQSWQKNINRETQVYGLFLLSFERNFRLNENG